MIKIITDSASDITEEYAKKHDITILPFHISFKDEEYLDGVTLSSKEFFLKLIESDELPKTSQISPYEFQMAYEEYPKDEILVITLSSKLSGTYQSACLAVEDREDIKVVDSLNATVGEKVLVEYAVKLRDEGKSLEEIEKLLNYKKTTIKLVGLLDTLEYLKKGGRIGAITASIGTFLQIKPVIEIKNGEVVVIGKARGSRNGSNMLREKVKEYGIDFDMPYGTAYSGLSDHILIKYIEDSKDLYPNDTEISKCILGSTIGTHIGPGAIAVAFFSNKV